MKTTIDIPEPLYRKVKMRALQRGVSLRDLVLGALQDSLRVQVTRSLDQPHFEVDELGIPMLRREKGDATVITNEFIDQLREQEGV